MYQDPYGLFLPKGQDPYGLFQPSIHPQDTIGLFRPVVVSPFEKGFFSKIAESFERGKENTLADVAIYEALSREPDELPNALETRKRLLRQQVLEPIESNWLTDFVYTSARTAGQMWESAKRGGKGAVIGAPIGAAAGLAVGALIPSVGEEVPLMAAGAKAGLKLGAAEGAALFSYKQGVGNIYADLIDQKTDPELASQIARIAGIPYALIEVLQLKGLTPQLKGAATAALSKTTQKILGKAIKKYGKTLTSEVLEELGQEIVQIGAEDVAKVLGKQGLAIDANYIKERGSRLLQVATESAKAFALLPVPGAAIETSFNIESANMAREIEALKKMEEEGIDLHYLTPEDVQSPIMKVAAAIRVSSFAYEAQEQLRKAERAERFSEAQEIRNSISDESWRSRAKESLKGKYTALGIEPLKNKLPAEVYLALDQEIRTSEVLDLPESIQLGDALSALFEEGKIFRPFELRLAEKQWGTGVATMLEKAGKVKETLIDYLALPKATAAAIDLSRTLRQNLLLVGGPAVFFKGFVTDVHLLAQDEKAARRLEKADLIALEQTGNLLQKTGIRWNDWGGVGYSRGTEKFASRIAGKVPGVARSERAFAMGGNHLRALKILGIAHNRKGMVTTRQQWSNIGHIINILSGEGDPKTFGKYAHALNAIFFAPRLAEARIKAITTLADLRKWTDPNWRPAMKILAYHVSSAIGFNLGILGLASLVPGVDVEKDPRSTDFGKIRIGDTHIDFWGGYLPLARLVMRLAHPYRKTRAGRVIPAEYYDTVVSFLQSKLGPAPAFALDLIRGQTFYGDYVGFEAESLTEQFYHRFVPFFIQDLVDAVRYSGWSTGLGTAPLAFLGASVQSYPITSSVQSLLNKNELSMQVLGRKWDDLGPDVQGLLKEEFPEIETWDRKAQFDKANLTFLQWIEKQRDTSSKGLYKVMPRDIQKEFDRLKIKPSGISRTIATDWFLNDKRAEQYQSQTEKAYKEILTTLIRQNWWPKAPDELKIELLTEVMNDIKAAIRQQIVDQANMTDLIQVKR